MHASDITVTIDGEAVIFEDVQPKIINGRVLVPVRAVFEKMGFVVETGEFRRNAWHSSYVPAAVLYDGTTKIQMQINGNIIIATGIGRRYSSTHSQLYNNRLFVPLRLMSEVANAKVQWNGSARKVIIKTAVAESTCNGNHALNISYRYFHNGPFFMHDNPLYVITSQDELSRFVFERWVLPLVRVDASPSYHIPHAQFVDAYCDDFFRDNTLVFFMHQLNPGINYSHLSQNGDVVFISPLCRYGLALSDWQIFIAYEIPNNKMPTSFAAVIERYDNFSETCSACHYRRYGIRIPRDEWEYHGITH